MPIRTMRDTDRQRAVEALDPAQPIVLQPQGGVEPAPPVGFRLQCRFLECHDSMLDVAAQPLRHAVVKADAVDAGRSDDLAAPGTLQSASPPGRDSPPPLPLPN